ncbi:Thioredoxin domain-containing protein plp1 [Lasiodiplodia hormozganensis]|uniref:Thioredoxin domain-containing protein plp1 n=2 Tax=Lasiodiplodia TaxID=66739 RepID=A0A5N5DGN5_9PEZI|nr:GTPAse inhibitor [Lasiodiplodia theobromae]KAB2576999.1 Thioredoxin domain-containing protein plp1 [Lasiodiplodia theobromae]KAF4543600.1 GTPAse inhibitor [Lasiodiplodia theobromae]KAK0662275.1 Thioredoxin domain-containing protein plp1 [Lasiodiplodia hormozganensis]
MSNIDAKVAAIVDKPHDSDDEDALIAELEDDDALDAFREQRLQQLHQEFTRAKQMRNSEHGTYQEIKEEKALMDITTSTKLCVVHFFHADFNRCRIMDNHLETLAPKHFDTRFLRINVDNAPFLVTKLKVQVLPCVIAFVDGQGVDRIVGFEGLGYGTDKFTTSDLERRLLKCGVLVREKMTEGQTATLRRAKKEEEEYDDDDWD